MKHVSGSKEALQGIRDNNTSQIWLPDIRPLTGVSGLRPDAGVWGDFSLGSSSTSLQLQKRQKVEDVVFLTDPGTSRSLSQSSTSWAHDKSARSTYSGNSGRRPISALQSSLSERVLQGVSTNTFHENARTSLSLNLLSSSASAPQLRRAPTLQRTKTNSGFTSQENQESGLKDFDRLSSTISEIRTTFEAFDPRRSKQQVSFSDLMTGMKGPAQDTTGSRRENEQAKLDARERQAERLQAYKFSRRLQQELPPLVPLAAGPQQRVVPQSLIVAKNTSPEAIRCWQPDARRSRLEDQKEEKQHRTELYQHMRDELIEKNTEHFAKELERKQQQAIAVVNSRHEKGQRTSRQMAQQWLTLMALVPFIDNLHQELSFRKLRTSERLAFARKKSARKSSIWISKESLESLEEAERLNELCDTPALKRIIVRVVTILQMKKLVRKCRAEAKKVYSAMFQWQVAGVLLHKMKSVVLKARILQCWWRHCSERLKMLRDAVSQRWERLERASLALEFSRSDKPQIRRQNTRVRVCGPHLSLDDKISLHRIPEDQRLRFIENELRARRFFLLPQIEAWHMEWAAWSLDYERCKLEKEAFNTLGQAFGHAPEHGFRFMPIQPSHLPPDHPMSEVLGGGACSETCKGRAGDEEILEMIRRCSKDPFDWKKVPRIGVKFGRSKSKIVVDEEPPEVDVKKATSLEAIFDEAVHFGKLASDELHKFGVAASEMPGGEPPF